MAFEHDSILYTKVNFWGWRSEHHQVNCVHHRQFLALFARFPFPHSRLSLSLPLSLSAPVEHQPPKQTKKQPQRPTAQTTNALPHLPAHRDKQQAKKQTYTRLSHKKLKFNETLRWNKRHQIGVEDAHELSSRMMFFGRESVSVKETIDDGSRSEVETMTDRCGRQHDAEREWMKIK
jgi:hypothetical protein